MVENGSLCKQSFNKNNIIRDRLSVLARFAIMAIGVPCRASRKSNVSCNQ